MKKIFQYISLFVSRVPYVAGWYRAAQALPRAIRWWIVILGFAVCVALGTSAYAWTLFFSSGIHTELEALPPAQAFSVEEVQALIADIEAGSPSVPEESAVE